MLENMVMRRVPRGPSLSIFLNFTARPTLNSVVQVFCTSSRRLVLHRKYLLAASKRVLTKSTSKTGPFQSALLASQVLFCLFWRLISIFGVLDNVLTPVKLHSPKFVYFHPMFFKIGGYSTLSALFSLFWNAHSFFEYNTVFNDPLTSTLWPLEIKKGGRISPQSAKV